MQHVCVAVPHSSGLSEEPQEPHTILCRTCLDVVSFFQNVRLELQYYPCSPISQRPKRMPHNLRCYGRQTGEMFAMHLVGSQAATSLVLLRIVNNRASLKRKAGSFLRIGNEASPDWCSSAYLAYLVHLRDTERESGRVGCTKEDWRQNRLIPFGATNENSRCISLGFISPSYP